MLRGNASVSHYTPGNVAVWMTLAFQAGLVNIGGFLACHHFVSHVTGGITIFSGGRPSHAGAYLVAPVCFLLGAVTSGILVDRRLQRGEKPRYYLEFLVLFAVLLFVLAAGIGGAFGSFGEPLDGLRDYALLALLSLACGIQNGTVTTVSRSVIRTTHLTGLITDLGIGLVRVLGHAAADRPGEVRANYMRIGIVACFVGGCAVGGAAFRRLGFAAFAIPAATCGVLLGVMVYFQVLAPGRRERA